MNSLDAFARLRGLGVPVVTTADAAVALGQTSSAAGMTMARLCRAGLVTKIRHGIYWIDGTPDPYRLPEYLSAPYPSYVSLLTALQMHGLIEQIPQVVYTVSLGRTRKTRTSVGTYSFHHVAPEVFGGYSETPSGVKLASAEKALFDWAYLSSSRSKLFTRLPEVELPDEFDTGSLDRWLGRIPSPRSRTLTGRKLEPVVGGHLASGDRGKRSVERFHLGDSTPTTAREVK